MDRILSKHCATRQVNYGDDDILYNDIPSVPRFDIAPSEHPAAFLAKHLDVNSKNPKATIKASHGTTTLAFKYQGGIIVAVDSRATSGTFIASGNVKKVIEIDPYIIGTMAGGAADCQYWLGFLGTQCRLYELRNKERISIAAASKILVNIIESYRGMGLSMGSMVCGYDKSGPSIFYVDSDGGRYSGNLFSVGSGQSYAYGVLDLGYRYDMTDDEAKALGQRAIYHAGIRDAFSGNSVNVYHIKADGWEYCGNTNFNDLHYVRGFGYEHRTGYEQA